MVISKGISKYHLQNLIPCETNWCTCFVASEMLEAWCSVVSMCSLTDSVVTSISLETGSLLSGTILTNAYKKKKEK